MALFQDETSRKRRIPTMPPEMFRPGNRPSMESLAHQINNLIMSVSKLEKKLDDIEKQVRDGGYISRTEFNQALNTMVPKEGRYWLVERLVFGGVTVVLLAALGAVLYTIGWVR